MLVGVPPLGLHDGDLFSASVAYGNDKNESQNDATVCSANSHELSKGRTATGHGGAVPHLELQLQAAVQRRGRDGRRAAPPRLVARAGRRAGHCCGRAFSVHFISTQNSSYVTKCQKHKR